MSTRRPLQPLSPLSANIARAKPTYEYGYDYNPNTGTNGNFAMEQDDTQALGDNVTEPLTDLENDDAADDFDRLMIQNAREERRINNAHLVRPQPFSKARVHPRVGVTLENLERHNARDHGVQVQSATAHVKLQSPPSSSGSNRSDPMIHPPATWGRKARVSRSRSWMRTITSEEVETQEDAQDLPRRSVEDSPLSHKSSIQGTPAGLRQQRLDDDWSFDLENASVIASTPYVPRNTALEDIRQREIVSLREQGVAKSRTDQRREVSPEEQRRTGASSGRSTSSQPNGTAVPEHPEAHAPSTERLRKRTNPQAIGHPKAAAVESVEKSPVVVYKRTLQTIGVTERSSLANARSDSVRPQYQREDSHDILRRLARVSTTPSPNRISAKPQENPSRQPDNPSQATFAENSRTQPGNMVSAKKSVRKPDVNEAGPSALAEQPQSTQNGPVPETVPTSLEARKEDVDATPLPEDRSILNPKTPVVTGAWIDTPRPTTVRQRNEPPQSHPMSPENCSPSKQLPQNQPADPVEPQPSQPPPEATRPNLPRSALGALIEEARANGRRRRPSDFGDSTINSLEELIVPHVEASEVDEDTLHGLELPTGAPRNEAERQRQQELLQIHRMNENLRAARTSIRDTSRGITRVEHQLEHVEERDENGERVRIIRSICPCAVNGGQECTFSVWKAFKSMFYDERLKRHRRYKSGLTWLSIALLSFLTWLVAENIAWYVEIFPSYTL
jgi:hypothetical protein